MSTAALHHETRGSKAEQSSSKDFQGRDASPPGKEVTGQQNRDVTGHHSSSSSKDGSSSGKDHGNQPTKEEKTKLEKKPSKGADLPIYNTGIWKYQDEARDLYASVKVQVVVATLICVNFLTNLVEKEVDPDQRAKYPQVWDNLELFFNIVFLLELILNMYGTWFYPFWMNSWNVFDFVVVSIGVLDTAKVPLPGPLTMLRMMRAFRVFRLFKRIESLNKIVVSLVHAIPGMMNAFFINALFMCIYAVLAVDFFGNASEAIQEACDKKDSPGGETVMTSRGQCWGDEYFGTFGRSLYSLFQVLSGDSWSEAVVRPSIFVFFSSPVDQICAALFFVSFILLNAIVLINVVIAVLLEKMAAAGKSEEKEEKAELQAAQEDDPEEESEVLSLQTSVEEMSTSVTHELQASKDAIGTLGKQVMSLLSSMEDLGMTDRKWRHCSKAE